LVSGTLFQSANGLYSSSSLPSFGTPEQKAIVIKLYQKQQLFFALKFISKTLNYVCVMVQILVFLAD
jgi:hypothetical protein